MPFVFVEVNERGNRPRKKPTTQAKPGGLMNDCAHLSDEEWKARLAKRSARLKAHGSHTRSRLIDKLDIPKPCKEVLHWIDKYTKNAAGWRGTKPSVSTGLKETGLSRKRFFECRKSLEHNGLIRVKSGQRACQTNEYEILEDELPKFLPGGPKKFVYAAYCYGENKQIFRLFNEFLRNAEQAFPGRTGSEILTYLYSKLLETRVDSMNSHLPGGDSNRWRLFEPAETPTGEKGPRPLDLEMAVSGLGAKTEKNADRASEAKSPLPPFNAVQPTQSDNCTGSLVGDRPKTRGALRVPAQLPLPLMDACAEAGRMALQCGAHEFVLPSPVEVAAGKPAQAVARFRLPMGMGTGEFEMRFEDLSSSDQQKAMQQVFAATLAGFGLLDATPAPTAPEKSIGGLSACVSAASKKEEVPLEAGDAGQQAEGINTLAADKQSSRLYVKQKAPTLLELTSSEEYVTRRRRMEDLLFSKSRQTRRAGAEKLSPQEVKKLSPKERAAYYRKQKYARDKSAKEAKKRHQEKIDASRFYVFDQFLRACLYFKRSPFTQEMQPQDKRWVDALLKRVSNDIVQVQNIIWHAVEYWDYYALTDKKLFKEPDFNQLLAEWRIKRYQHDFSNLEKFKVEVRKSNSAKQEQAESKVIMKEIF